MGWLEKVKKISGVSRVWVSLRSWDIGSELSRGGTLENQIPSVASNHSHSFTIRASGELPSCCVGLGRHQHRHVDLNGYMIRTHGPGTKLGNIQPMSSRVLGKTEQDLET